MALPGWVAALSTLVMALVTGVWAWLAYRQNREFLAAEKQRIKWAINTVPRELYSNEKAFLQGPRPVLLAGATRGFPWALAESPVSEKAVRTTLDAHGAASVHNPQRTGEFHREGPFGHDPARTPGS